MSIKLLGIAGSLRQKSTNKGLLRAAQANLPEGVSLELAELGDIPFYNADITDKPAAVSRVLAQIAAARRDLTAALLVAQKAGRASASALGENDARIASAGEQLELLVEKGEPSLDRKSVV